jgi:hypothetical protein
VHELRPTVCRLWGVVDVLPCNFGCRPDRFLTMAEGYELLAQAAEIDGDQAAAVRFRASVLADPTVAEVVTPLMTRYAHGEITAAEFKQGVRDRLGASLP